jgi:3-isopropylmalate dehydrogenase
MSSQEAASSPSTPKRVAVVGGDGIGPEVVSEALKCIDSLGLNLQTQHFDLGADRYKRDGEVLSDSTVEELRSFDAILLGAVGAAPGDARVPPGLIERGMLLKLRFQLDHYVNLRPFVSSDLDFVFVREGTEGSYAGEGGFLRKGTPSEIATQGSVNTRMGVERCVRYAFELANARPRKTLTLVHKTNVLTFAGDLWQRTFNEVASEYVDVTTEYSHVDAACIHLVNDPGRYDVIVTDNLFGDILTDLAGAVAGGIGLAASANLNPSRVAPSMFEPVHGSAPDIAGTAKANPIAAIRSAAMMLDFLGFAESAVQLNNAVSATLASPELIQGDTETIGARVRERL